MKYLVAALVWLLKRVGIELIRELVKHILKHILRGDLIE